jgi:hypothetical protein
VIRLATIARDTPLAELTLRRYEKPEQLDNRGLVRKLCLSLGLLQPGDSRDIVVDVLCVLLANKKNRTLLTCDDVRDIVIEHRKDHNLTIQGSAASNIRRQLKRLRDVMIVEKVLNSYRITEYADLSTVITEKIEKYLLASLLLRVKEYVKCVDDVY